MSNGNAHQSAWSADFHANRSSNTPNQCPVEGGCGGDCMAVHPRGIVVDAAGRWRAVPPINPDDMIPLFVEHYA